MNRALRARQRLSFRGEAEKSFVRIRLKIQDPSLTLGMTKCESIVHRDSLLIAARIKEGRESISGGVSHGQNGCRYFD
jgi:hypothetical protein